jgi:hypothetical protein
MYPRSVALSSGVAVVVAPRQVVVRASRAGEEAAALRAGLAGAVVPTRTVDGQHGRLNAVVAGSCRAASRGAHGAVVAERAGATFLRAVAGRQRAVRSPDRVGPRIAADAVKARGAGASDGAVGAEAASGAGHAAAEVVHVARERVRVRAVGADEWVRRAGRAHVAREAGEREGAADGAVLVARAGRADGLARVRVVPPARAWRRPDAAGAAEGAGGADLVRVGARAIAAGAVEARGALALAVLPGVEQKRPG